MQPDASFWAGKRVFLTGHTGFKGGWLALWLQRMGAQVSALALPPATEPNLFSTARVDQGMDSRFVDLRQAQEVASALRASQPEVVFHLAAQPLVRESYRHPLDTYATNVMGTAHVLDALRDLPSVRVAVMITTDKVYRPLVPPRPYQEGDPLGGHDPYSASKAACELVIASYRDSWLAAQGVALASARAGNVIGGGDWSAERLIPDVVRAWQAEQPVVIRAPHATRPWQHVLEPLAGYLVLAQRLWVQPELAGAYNFGPESDAEASVQQVVELARAAYGAGAFRIEGDAQGWHEADALALDASHTRRVLGVQPRWSLAQAVARTMAWYRALHSGADARTLCLADLEAFTS